MSKRKVTEAMAKLLVDSASSNPQVATAAQAQLAVALTEPLRSGVMAGDIIGDIFETIDLQPGIPAEFPLDTLDAAGVKDFVAYTMPHHGYIPQRDVSADSVLVRTYEIGSSVDWLLRIARYTRWDLVTRNMQRLESSFTKKRNDDGWHILLQSGASHSSLVYDGAATAGLFTKRLVSMLKTRMRRGAGGNSTSINRGKLTDLYISPEAEEDIRNWGVDQLDEITRHQIYNAPDGKIQRIFQVNLHDIDELGINQEYQNYFLDEIGGSFPASKVELVVGLDLESNDAFVMPEAEPITIEPDPTLRRQRREGFYGWAEQGFGCLDARRVILGAF